MAPRSHPTSPKLLALLLLLATAAGIEGLARLGAVTLVSRGILYRAPSLVDYDRYRARRDERLGWTASSFEGARLDASGSREIPAFRDPGRHAACVSLYGDSFTWADEVAAEHAWGNVLSERLGCRVSNYGVRAYGTDQTYLRFRGNSDDAAGVVVLGHLSENVLRNVTRDFGLLYRAKYLLKPRFILDEAGNLELVPTPDYSREELARHREAPGAAPHEFFSPAQFGFPYTLSLLRAFSHYRVQARLRDRPHYAAFYSPDHPSRALEITARILERFCADARSRGKRPLVLVIPAELDFPHHRKTGGWAYQPLIDRLADGDVPLVELGPRILEQLGDTEPRTIFAERSHLNEEGNRVMAAAVHAVLEERGLVP